MFDNIGRVSERVATSVSRRQFLGRVGRWAAVTATALAGVLTTEGVAQAAGGRLCCTYQGAPQNPPYICGTACVDATAGCDAKRKFNGFTCFLLSSTPVSDCRQC
jgi:hypothetical protein